MAEVPNGAPLPPSPEEIGWVIDGLRDKFGYENDGELFRALAALLYYWPDSRKGGSDVLIGRVGPRVGSAIRRAKLLLRIKKNSTWFSISTDMLLAYAAAVREKGSVPELLFDGPELEKAIRNEEGPE